MNAVPYLAWDWFNWVFDSNPVRPAALALPETWFQNYGPDVNYFQLFGGTRSEEVSPMFLFGYSDPEADLSYVLRGACEKHGDAEGQSAAAVDYFTQETTAHELGHQWDLNCCTITGHCGRDAWCQASGCGPDAADPEKCVIAGAGPAASDWDPVMRYCTEDLFLGDPTCDEETPRCHDPMPPGWTKEESALRTASDPR